MTEDDAIAEIIRLRRGWLEAKQAEQEAMANRRKIEDEMTKMLSVPKDQEGVMVHELIDGSVIKVTGRMNRKVDAEKLRDLAVEAGVEDHLANLVRWKAELNLTAWKHADESITKPLAGAITTKPGRPSFSIEEKNNG